MAITKNSTNVRFHFVESMRVILLVEDDTMGDYLHFRIELETFRIYMRMYTVDKSTKRWILTSLKIDEPFGAQFQPMSVESYSWLN
jgi:hypothetical protein